MQAGHCSHESWQPGTFGPGAFSDRGGPWQRDWHAWTSRPAPEAEHSHQLGEVDFGQEEVRGFQPKVQVGLLGAAEGGTRSRSEGGCQAFTSPAVLGTRHRDPEARIPGSLGREDARGIHCRPTQPRFQGRLPCTGPPAPGSWAASGSGCSAARWSPGRCGSSAGAILRAGH